MGMFLFYRQHIPHYAHIVEPLQQLLNATQPKQSCRRKNCQQQSAPTPFIMLEDRGARPQSLLYFEDRTR